jgi:hypothetical protein
MITSGQWVAAIMFCTFLYFLTAGLWKREIGLRRMAYWTGACLCAGGAFGFW